MNRFNQAKQRQVLAIATTPPGAITFGNTDREDINNSYQKSSQSRFPRTNWQDKNQGSQKIFRDRANSPQGRVGFGRSQKYCTLCGMTGHTPQDVCYQMRNQAGKIVTVVPCYQFCDTCYRKLNKKLFHPREFCISRENYPKLASNQNPKRGNFRKANSK